MYNKIKIIILFIFINNIAYSQTCPVITEPDAITVNCGKTDVTINNGNDGTASVTVSGGTSPYSYLWSNGATTASLTGLTKGTYSVTVTDANTCAQQICSSIVAEPACALTASAIGVSPKCNAGTDGSVALTVTGAVGTPTYLWSNGATTQNLSTVAAGTYSVTVTDGACQANGSITLTEPSILVVTCSKTDVTTQGGNDGTASVAASGGTGTLTYLWSNGATTASIATLTVGAYSVTITDANGCKNSCSLIVEEPNCVTITEPSCTLPIVGVKTPSEGTCTNNIPNDDATVIFSMITNADKADKVIGATYTAGTAYSAATLSVATGNLTATGLKHNTQYTFRFWNASDCCFIDVTLTTPIKTCTPPCPIKICTGVKITKL